MVDGWCHIVYTFVIHTHIYIYIYIYIYRERERERKKELPCIFHAYSIHICAAAAWIIGLCDSEGRSYEPLKAGGTFINMPCTVFMTEAIALDEASAEVQRILQSISHI